MPTDLAHIYHYPFASHLEDGYGLRLATSGPRENEGRSPYFFEERLRRSDEMADMLLVLSEDAFESAAGRDAGNERQRRLFATRRAR